MDEVAVLVSDLHGFTSTTRKYGIIHFASIIMRKIKVFIKKIKIKNYVKYILCIEIHILNVLFMIIMYFLFLSFF